MKDIIKQIKTYCYNGKGRMNANINRHEWWKKNDLEYLRDYILEYTSFLPEDVKWKIRLWHVENETSKIPECEGCNKTVLFDLHNYRRFCNNCQYKSESVIERRKSTNLEKYGHTCSFHGEEAKNKSLNTISNRTPEQNREIVDKRKSTNLSKFGVEHAAQSEVVKVKTIQTNINKFGVEHPMHLEEFKEKISQTNVHRYGVANHSQSNFSKSTLEILNSREKLLELLSEKSVVLISDELSVDQNTVYKRVHDFELEEYIQHNVSSEELTVRSILDEFGIKYLTNVRNIIPPKELDIYIPDLKVAIEINGLYWHSETAGKNKTYHFDKWKQCKDKGISLYSIYDDDVHYKLDKVKSKLRYITSNNDAVVGARKCVVSSVNRQSEYKFLDEYHIQGKLYSCTDSIGAFYQNELVAVMNWRLNGNYLEITRYACNTKASYPGLFSKMMKFMISSTNHKGDIVSFSNNDHSNGNLYKQAGFEIDEILGPAYWYTKDYKVRENRQRFMKGKIKEKFKIDISNRTEWQLMQELGYDRIWDSGKIKWLYKVNK